jgi:hypothetical protein
VNIGFPGVSAADRHLTGLAAHSTLDSFSGHAGQIKQKPVLAVLIQKGAAFIFHSCQRNKGIAHRNRFPVANIESTF